VGSPSARNRRARISSAWRESVGLATFRAMVSPAGSSAPRRSRLPRHLRVGGLLVTYGPYLENGTAVPSNLDFDASLKRRNADWGLRDLDDVTRVAAERGIARRQVVRMPANNLSVVFAKTA